jgi:hypothetical protein
VVPEQLQQGFLFLGSERMQAQYSG